MICIDFYFLSFKGNLHTYLSQCTFKFSQEVIISQFNGFVINIIYAKFKFLNKLKIVINQKFLRKFRVQGILNSFCAINLQLERYHLTQNFMNKLHTYNTLLKVVRSSCQYKDVSSYKLLSNATNRSTQNPLLYYLQSCFPLLPVMSIFPELKDQHKNNRLSNDHMIIVQEYFISKSTFKHSEKSCMSWLVYVRSMYLLEIIISIMLPSS